MDPEYDLSRLGYPGELGRFSTLVEEVTLGGDPLVITRHGEPVAVIVNVDDLDLLRRLAWPLDGKQSDE